jgi:4-amino-4-deoxy-L-arabinose transferase-like glycosyltransferase
MLTPRMLRLAVGALLIALTVPRMAQRGMFGDGLVYATIARNLSIGVGSLWAPTYTRTAWEEFFEHPPLGLALEAAAFWLLGDHLIVERLFALIVCGLHVLVVAAIWRRVHGAADSDWLPLLFWLTPSIVTWGVVNNMLENTQALFTSAAVLLLIDAGLGRDVTRTAIVTRSAIAGLAVVAAVLTKGPVGLFPLVTPLVFRAESPRQSRRTTVLVTIILVTIAMAVGLCGLALAAYAPSRRNLTMYVLTHLAPTLQGRRDVSDPLAIVHHLAIGIVGRMVLLLVVCWWLGRRRGTTAAAQDAARSSLAWRFLALGWCAAGPVAISPKVSGHYLLPSVPLFALGFATLARGFLAAPRASSSSPPIGRGRLATAVAATVLVVTVALSAAGPRDAAMLRDLDAIGAAMPRDLTIGACRHPRSTRDWGLHTYVQRWYRVSLDARGVPRNGWLLQADDSCPAPASCVAVARGDSLTLFRCDIQASE